MPAFLSPPAGACSETGVGAKAWAHPHAAVVTAHSGIGRLGLTRVPADASPLAALQVPTTLAACAAERRRWAARFQDVVDVVAVHYSDIDVTFTHKREALCLSPQKGCNYEEYQALWRP
jgi:hypothetical protein